MRTQLRLRHDGDAFDVRLGFHREDFGTLAHATPEAASGTDT
ncbi:hypothetical protein ACIQVT_09090 [Streptomyces sp. NPDC100445]